MTWLICSYGACFSFDESARLLRGSLSITISATAVRNSCENIGHTLPDTSDFLIEESESGNQGDEWIISSDGTMSPQIHQEEGVSGREGLKQPTEYKECNLLSLTKQNAKGEATRFIGGAYGKRSAFEKYVGYSLDRFGYDGEAHALYIADGATHNWEMAASYFPEATQILDFYHASEHLHEFCELLPRESGQRKEQFINWRHRLKHEGINSIYAEMRTAVDTMENRDAGTGQLNYFTNNRHRMKYDEYRRKNYPIGSGVIEAQCKLVVGRRFKGNGMRWFKENNDAVLKVRLAFLNDKMKTVIKPEPRVSWPAKRAA